MGEAATSSTKSLRSVRLPATQVPAPPYCVGSMYLPLLQAFLISTFVMRLFHERFCPTAKRTAVRACLNLRLVVGATPRVSYFTSPEQAVMRSF